MPTGLYSDPYLKALIEREPKLAQEFFEATINSDWLDDSVIYCLEVPEWVLEKVGPSAAVNPNFPLQRIDDLIQDRKILLENFRSIFKFPHLNQNHINKLIQDEDINIRGLALAHRLSDKNKLLSYLREATSGKSNSDVLDDIARIVDLSDDIFNFFVSVHDFETTLQTLGQALWENSSLSAKQKTLLISLDILAEKDPERIFWNAYWGKGYHHFISSIPYFQLLKVNFFANINFNKLSNLNPKIEKFFTEMGHHLSLLLPIEASRDYELTRDSLLDLNSHQLMQRLFWTDLCERADFKIYRRNAYRTDDLFISHPILSREFEEADPEVATSLGGVFDYNDQNWLLGEETLGEYGATHVLGAYQEYLEVMLEDDFYELIGQKLIALAITVPEIKDKYGFQLTDYAQNWMIEAVLEYADQDLFDVSAELNPSFDETLSWQKIPDSKKEIIFDLLSIGFNENESKLRNDCRHFLGCMALHEETPRSILQRLSKLQDPLIDEILESRI